MAEHKFTGNIDDYTKISLLPQLKSKEELTLYIKKESTDKEKQLCMEYWAINAFYSNTRIDYKESIYDIGKRHGIPKTSVSQIVAKASFIAPESEKCEKCGALLATKLSVRNHLTYCSNKGYCVKLCDGCRKKEDIKAKEKQTAEAEHRQEEAVKQYRINLNKHVSAIENSIYETLSKLELNYLINLAEMGDSSKVAKIMGISDQKRRNFHEKLAELKLIITHYRGGYYMDADFNKALCNLEKYSNIKSVFGSKPAYELYKKLKKEYLYVYPEMPLAAFIKMEQVEHLFTENWHNGYFLMCRLDCVVTNPEGIPKFGVEFQGGYHEKEEQQTKDNFKRLLMNDVGLEIQYYDYSDFKK